MRYIFITSSFEGLHRYPDAPDDVAYLRNSHRHIFGLKIKVEVKHNDRELEFIRLQHKVNTYLDAKMDDNHVWNLGRRSCEDVAQELLEFLRKEYGTGFIDDRWMSVEVNEDGFCGAVVDNSVSRLGY